MHDHSEMRSLKKLRNFEVVDFFKIFDLQPTLPYRFAAAPATGDQIIHRVEAYRI